MPNDQFMDEIDFKEKEKGTGKKKILIILLLILGVIVLGIGIIFIFTRMNAKLELLEYDTSWTNESILLTVKKVNHALYSFNKEEYSTSNTYEVDKNVKNLSYVGRFLLEVFLYAISQTACHYVWNISYDNGTASYLCKGSSDTAFDSDGNGTGYF